MVLSSANIASHVREILERNVVYSVVLDNDLVSASKLSRQIMDELAVDLRVSKKALKMNTVVKAVKRYLEESRKFAVHGAFNIRVVQAFLAQSHLVVRSDLAVLCSKMSAHFPEKLSKIIKYLYTKEDHILHVAQASTAVTLIFDECELKTVEEIINPEYTLYSRTNCAAIKILAPIGIIEQPGTFAYILNLLATKGINMITITFSYNEMIIIVDRKDEVKAFDVLKKEIDRLRAINLIASK